MRPSPIQGLLVQTCNPFHPRHAPALLPQQEQWGQRTTPPSTAHKDGLSFPGFPFRTVEGSPGFRLLRALRTRAGPGPAVHRWRPDRSCWQLRQFLCWDCPVASASTATTLSLPSVPWLCRARGKLSKGSGGLRSPWGMEGERGVCRAKGEARAEALAELEKGEEGVKGTLQDLLAEMNPRASSQSSFVLRLF